jgi:hypothetical protein
MASQKLLDELIVIAQTEWDWTLSQEEATDLASRLTAIYRALLDV